MSIKIEEAWKQSNGNYKCPYCGKEFKKAGIATHIFRSHTERGRTLKPPNMGIKLDRYTIMENARKHKLAIDKRSGVFKLFKVNCHKCGKELEVKERTKQFPKKDKYFCSRSCANTRTPSTETKSKISSSVKVSWTYDQKVMRAIGNSTKIYIHNCDQCGKLFIARIEHGRFCSPSCIGKYACSQNCRRSKNEIHFYDLCNAYFNNIDHNEPIFNGWDADVIIHDIKYAVLWNGKWHYEKITKKHSVKQVQNRDKIKLKEITAFGYIPYTIKDMGGEDYDFVKCEFVKFIAHLGVDPSSSGYEPNGITES